MAFRLDRAPLVDFCNHHSPRAHPQDRPIPASRWNERALAHVARRRRSRDTAGRAAALDPGFSAQASHDDGSPHLEERVAPSRCIPTDVALAGRHPCGLRKPLPDEAPR
jgi:hypothetical protein